MTQDKIPPTGTNSNQAKVSDGSELIPAEAPVNTRQAGNASTEKVAIPGSTVDDEGLINNFATEPPVYPAKYPSPQQQRRYIFLGLGALVFIAILIAISFSIS